MKILFVLENYLPHIGGVEIVFKNLCEGLAAQGHEVTIITHRMKGTPKKERINGVNVVRVRCFDSRYLFTFAAVSIVLRYAKYSDIVHTTTFNGAPPAWLGARLRGKKVLITVHETWIGKWKDYTNFPLVSVWLHELLERAVFMPKYDAYACVSQSTADALVKAKPKIKDKVVVVHNGFDPAMWKKPRDNEAKKLRNDLGLHGKFVIFAYGRPGTSKGFEYLYDAYPKIRKQIPDAALLLMLSKDKQYARVVDKMRTHAPNGVKIIDSVKYNTIPSYTHMADCIVVPSITEGFGYVVLESVASGKPVVASDTTSIPEVIWGKHVLVKPRSSEAIAKGVVAVKAGKYNVTPEKAFSWKENMKKYMRIYTRALSMQKKAHRNAQKLSRTRE